MTSEPYGQFNAKTPSQASCQLGCTKPLICFFMILVEICTASRPALTKNNIKHSNLSHLAQDVFPIQPCSLAGSDDCKDDACAICATPPKPEHAYFATYYFPQSVRLLRSCVFPSLELVCATPGLVCLYVCHLRPRCRALAQALLRLSLVSRFVFRFRLCYTFRTIVPITSTAFV